MAHNDGSEVIASRDGFGVGIRDLPVAMWLLVKNPVNMLVTLGAVTEGLLTSGFATFMPKFLQNQYGLTAGAAAMLGGRSVVIFYVFISHQSTRYINIYLSRDLL